MSEIDLRDFPENPENGECHWHLGNGVASVYEYKDKAWELVWTGTGSEMLRRAANAMDMIAPPNT